MNRLVSGWMDEQREGQIGSQKGNDRSIDQPFTCEFLPQLLITAKLNQAEARNWELSVSVPYVWQGHQWLSHLLLHARLHISGKLDLEA